MPVSCSVVNLSDTFLHLVVQLLKSWLMPAVMLIPSVRYPGAVLHVHDASLLDVHWLIKNATYDPQCFICTNHSFGDLQFHFFDKPPSRSGSG